MGGPFSSLRRAVYWTKSIPVLYIPFKSTHEQNGIFLLGKKFSILRFSFECLLQFIVHSMYVVLMQDHYLILGGCQQLPPFSYPVLSFNASESTQHSTSWVLTSQVLGPLKQFSPGMGQDFPTLSRAKPNTKVRHPRRHLRNRPSHHGSDRTVIFCRDLGRHPGVDINGNFVECSCCTSAGSASNRGGPLLVVAFSVE